MSVCSLLKAQLLVNFLHVFLQNLLFRNMYFHSSFVLCNMKKLSIIIVKQNMQIRNSNTCTVICMASAVKNITHFSVSVLFKSNLYFLQSIEKKTFYLMSPPPFEHLPFFSNPYRPLLIHFSKMNEYVCFEFTDMLVHGDSVTHLGLGNTCFRPQKGKLLLFHHQTFYASKIKITERKLFNILQKLVCFCL